MDGTEGYDDRLDAALGEHAEQERAYDELLSRHGLTREAVARAGEGRFLAPGRRAQLAAAKDAVDDQAPPAVTHCSEAVPPHAVSV